jgi:hypothetical protein
MRKEDGTMQYSEIVVEEKQVDVKMINRKALTVPKQDNLYSIITFISNILII